MITGTLLCLPWLRASCGAPAACVRPSDRARRPDPFHFFEQENDDELPHQVQSLALHRRAGRRHSVLPLLAAAAPPQTASDSGGFPIVYGDLDAFASAIEAMEAGAEAKAAIGNYLAAASPGMQIFVSRFGVNVDSMAARLARYPRYYRYLASLRPQVEARELELRKAIAALQASAPEGSRPVPVYYLVANMTAGGNPGIVETPQGRRRPSAWRSTCWRVAPGRHVGVSRRAGRPRSRGHSLHHRA